MKRIIVAAMFLTSLGVFATGLPCTIHPSKGMSDMELAKLAKVTRADAESAALKAVNIGSAAIESGELEAEGGCLIYSFDIKAPGKQSITEVAVDAGTGNILAKKREGPNAQAAERAADAAAKH